jgi:hypothetical protein
MPETVEAQIDDGVRHMYFRHPGGLLHGCSALGAGIELHGDGNYVVVPPSIHVSGESYRWVRSPDVFPLAPLPIGLSRTLVVRDQTANPVAHWQHLSQTETAEGWRREAIASLAGYLLGKGVDGKVVLELMLCWNAIRCRPPLTPDAVIREVDRIEHR